MNKNYLLLAIFICALVALNIYILLGGKQAGACYKDACIVGERDPVLEIKALLNSSRNVIILAEGDTGSSQKNQFLSGAMVRLAKDFGYAENLKLMALEYDAGTLVRCTCERKVNATSFENCSAGPESCAAVVPDEKTVLLRLSYPSFEKNRIVVSNRTIDFQGKSGEDSFALVSELFERIF